MTAAARKVFSSCALLAALILLSAPPARAQVVRVDDYDAPVRAGAKATYLDLLRKVLPDLAEDTSAEPTAQTTVPLRHLFGDYRREVFRGALKVEGVDALPCKSAGREHLLLLVHVSSGGGGELFQWGEAAVLALFRLGPSAELLDAADVQADRFAGFWDERPRLPLAAGEDAAIVASSHHNAGQSYLSLALVGFERGRLKTIFELPGLLNEQQCGNSFTETPSVTTLKSQGGERHSILVKVLLDRGVNEDAGCTERVRRSSRTFKTTLVWNPRRRRYESRGGNLARLSRFNEKNY